jgi:hypothetical protein
VQELTKLEHDFLPSGLLNQESIKKVCEILDNQLSHELIEVAKKVVLGITSL